MNTAASLVVAIDPYLWGMLGAAAVFGAVVGWFLGLVKNRRALERARQELEQEREVSRRRIETMEQTFADLSHNALERNNRMFLELAQQSFGKLHAQARGELDVKEKAVENLVKPIREALDHTRREIQQLERDRHQAHGALTRHLESLVETQRALQGETRNLVQALRRPEVRGQWGELTLRRLAELAGMVEHCDFSEQVHTGAEDGHRRPDMIVRMPAGREVVVDVKTPLDAYLSAVEATESGARGEFLIQHARHIRTRVKELASKRYWEQFTDAPEFVVLFIPGDQFLSAALDQDPDLLEDALSRKVILATPTSFVALLRAIAYGWRQETLNSNAERIRQIGEDLYRRLHTLTDHMGKLGRQLDSSVAQYNRLVGSFDAKVLPGARKFAELGVPANEDIEPPEPIERQARTPSQATDDHDDRAE
ncbi:MAG: DNA recombination protein RmuC [Gammaproteobacteria bacterium]|nr:DNA recombination protein RmuC [Gammaproteobacteria bacterium]